jgi:methionyl-tRNA formyltransferase
MYHQQHHRIGTSVHLIDDGIDTGPLLATRVADLPERPLTPQRAHHLNALQGTQLLAETVHGYLNGRLLPRPQSPGGSTYTQPSPTEIAVVRQRLGRRIRVDFIE